ncbi:MAG TPA: hypothetical protein VNW92_12670, partial [Polyangiaceae bacterium]|nr:hypothetical protein [Polyangiaceae bacterium]
SREPLRARAEWISRLPTLSFPLESGPLSALEALSFSAVELFVERATAGRDDFELRDADAQIVADLCRRLDGIPLAIELAAARVDAMSLRELIAGLDDRLQLIMKGRRTALPRQQTLRGAMDWSFDMLSERQQLVLCGLSVFPASFDLAAAVAVLANPEFSPSEVFNEVTELASKSLVIADLTRGHGGYRLLVTTRGYALEKAVERGVLAPVQRRHAEHTLDRLRQPNRSPLGARQLCPPDVNLDDIRAALQWAYDSEGDTALAVMLTVAAVPLAASFSFHDEFRNHVARALDALKQRLPPDATTEMLLSIALGGLSLHTHGSSDAMYARALELWLKLDDSDEPDSAGGEQALEGVWASAFGAGDYLRAMGLAEQFLDRTSKSGDRNLQRNGDRLLGIALHFSGDHARARPPLQRAYDHFVLPSSWRPLNPVQIDLRVSAGISLARLLWLQGEWEAALDMAEEVVMRSTGSQHGPSICYTLAFLSCPLALWRGDTAEATRLVGKLAKESTRHALGLWQGWTRCYEALFEPAKVRPAEWNEMQRELLCTLREDLVTPELVSRVEGGLAGWCAPELLRAAGERLLRQKQPGAAAETLFERSLTRARAQGALFWELRTATSLGRLWRDQGEGARARRLLEPVLTNVGDEVSSLDVERAKVLLLEVS